MSEMNEEEREKSEIWEVVGRKRAEAISFLLLLAGRVLLRSGRLRARAIFRDEGGDLLQQLFFCGRFWFLVFCFAFFFFLFVFFFFLFFFFFFFLKIVVFLKFFLGGGGGGQKNGAETERTKLFLISGWSLMSTLTLPLWLKSRG